MVLQVLCPVLRLTLLLVSFSHHLQGFQAVQEHVAQPFSENEAQQAPRGLDRDRLALQEILARTPVGAAEGIVIPAGKRSQFTNCAALVILLREHLRTELPIEVFYNGQEERYSPALQLIEAYPGVRCTDASLFSSPILHRNISIAGFGFKVFALYMSSFEKVVLLDSDNMPFIEPARLLGDRGFTASGNLFWRDYFQRTGWNVVSAEAYEMFGLSPPWNDNPDYTSSESGQIIFDRRRHADVLEWLWFLQTHAEHLEGKMHGDKDMYQLAFALANKSAEYTQVHIPPRAAVHEEQQVSFDPIRDAPEAAAHGGAWLQSAMAQSTDSGALAFYHRTTSGGKQGRDGEDNPIRRWWPDFITTPVTGHIGPQVIGWSGEMGMAALDKGSFDSATFRCKAASESPWYSARHGLSGSMSRRVLAEEPPYIPQGEFRRQNGSTSLAPLPHGAETVCPWNGSLSISKTSVTAENGMQYAVDTLRAYQHAFDRVLHHISLQGL